MIRYQGLSRAAICKAFALVGAALISFFGFLVLVNWSDFGGHECYSRSGCSSSLFLFLLSYLGYVAPYVLMGSLGFVMVLVGFRGLTGATRAKYVMWGILVGAIVLIGLYFIVSFLWAAQPPSSASTTTSTTTVS
jgi:hypothetical protein